MKLGKTAATWLSALAVLPLFLAPRVIAQSSAAPGGEPFFVTTAWVAEHLQDPSLVLLEVGEKKDYERGHIPGARFLDYHKISTPQGSGLTLELPPVAQLVTVFQELGVTDQSRIVVYFGRTWLTPTARAYLTLDYLGMRDRTSILDGGLPAWRSENRPVSTDAPRVLPGSFTPHPRNDVVVKAGFVQQNLKRRGVALVDAREEACFTGEMNCGNPRKGHIPGAVNIPVASVAGEDGKLKSADELRRIFRAAGVQPGDQVVTYCHIGQKASLLYVLARSIGYDARMYDGSFEEWSALKDLPVEGP
jgi:thiosulfate/3-mercaptopyruvate sulfurtransferase